MLTSFMIGIPVYSEPPDVLLLGFRGGFGFRRLLASGFLLCETVAANFQLFALRFGHLRLAFFHLDGDVAEALEDGVALAAILGHEALHDRAVVAERLRHIQLFNIRFL